MRPTRAYLFLFLGSLAVFVRIVSADGIQYDSGGRRDPFVPLVGPDGTILKKFDATGLKVEGIIFDPKNGSLALINGEFYKAGDKLQNAVLAQIFKDRVILSQDDQEKVLWLREEGEEEEKEKEKEKNRKGESVGKTKEG